MSLDEQGYQEFRKTLHQCMDQSIRKNRPPDVREINMATTLPGLNLLFCRKEVSLLLRLMEMADTKMVNKELITDICDN